MPEPKLLKVFLCHASDDKPVVRELGRRLRAEGWLDVWLDEEKLLPGQDWDLEIEKAVETAHIVLVCLSKHSVSKEGYVQKELRLVLDVALNMPEGSIFVIPLRLEECEIPRRLRSWQWVNYFPPENRPAACERLLASLRLRAGTLGISVPGSVPAKVEPEKHFPEPEPPVIEKPGQRGTSAPLLELYVPPEYAGDAYVPPPSSVPTWTLGGIEFVKVPRGEFLMGSKQDDPSAYDDEKPQRKFDIPYDFLVARFPVTNRQFEAFIKASSYGTRAETAGYGWIWDGNQWVKTKGANWMHPRGPETNLEGLALHPVVQVNWHDTLAFCDWLNQEYGTSLPRGLVFRLSSEAEWEEAARGPDGRIWPWGNEFEAGLCNCLEGGPGHTTPVGAYSPQGDSPYGCADMAGNVWEWTSSLWGSDSGNPSFKYPYNARDGRENLKAGDDVRRIARGGSFGTEVRDVRCACRGGGDPRSAYGYRGFRVVVAPISR